MSRPGKGGQHGARNRRRSGGRAKSVHAGKRVPPARIGALVGDLLRQAVRDRCTELHIEPGDTGARVRFRIDGVLHDGRAIRQEDALPVVAHLRSLVAPDGREADHDLPQDGGFGFDEDSLSALIASRIGSRAVPSGASRCSQRCSSVSTTGTRTGGTC